MRFFFFILGSIGCHLALMLGLLIMRPPVLHIRGGEYCIEVRSTNASLPQKARVAGSPVDQKQVEELKRQAVKTAADSLEPYLDLARKVKEELKKESDKKKQAEKQVAKGNGNDSVTTPASAASSASVKKHGIHKIAKLVGNPSGTYPEEARSRGIQGSALVRIRVTKRGRVEVIKLEKSSGYKILDDAALRHAPKMVFEPARLDNTPIDEEYVQEFRFYLRD